MEKVMTSTGEPEDTTGKTDSGTPPPPNKDTGGLQKRGL
jgi:hypothetical protein